VYCSVVVVVVDDDDDDDDVEDEDATPAVRGCMHRKVRFDFHVLVNWPQISSGEFSPKAQLFSGQPTWTATFCRIISDGPAPSQIGWRRPSCGEAQQGIAMAELPLGANCLRTYTF